MDKLTAYSEFEKLFAGGGMAVSGEMYEKFCTYAELLCERNEQVNLTAITDPEGIALKHFYDSVYPFTLIDVPRGTSLIDVGTGAGFPSVPLTIYRPDIRLTLLDSLNKRVNFLQELTSALGIEAECIHSRAEEAARSIKGGNPLRGCFDMACARAVANLRDLCEYCLPFVKVGGAFTALKGRDGAEELAAAENAIKLLGGETELCREYALPNGDARTLIVIRKVKPTAEKYPRCSAQMKKKPLV